MKRFILLLLGLSVSVIGPEAVGRPAVRVDDPSASTPVSKREKRTTSEKRAAKEKIAQDTIDGVYIPADLEDCFRSLDSTLSDKSRETIAKLENRNATILLHHSLGMWIRNNWGLWNGSRLQDYFRQRGIDHPDSMSAIILSYYYDWLHGEHEGWREWHSTQKKSIDSF